MSFDYFMKSHGIDEKMREFEGVMPKVAEKVGVVGLVDGVNTTTIDSEEMLRHDSLEVADFQGLMAEEASTEDAGEEVPGDTTDINPDGDVDAGEDAGA